jgi:hypothetical protein
MSDCISTLFMAAGSVIGAVFAPVRPALAQGTSLTLCCLAWDLANALVELREDFTTEARPK